ncbi:MAG: MFS transporter [Solobacterium sp.]|nr:MFS transporter [Solobacterium sp.]MCH4223090.1 MFS transporter [Solobacterium sp.]MCH4265684.1 MFS transporter [Solobacterium sp.]
METTTGLWASSYLTLARNVDAVSAASWASLFYFGITVGRLICGFITDRLGDRKMVRCGQIIAVSGIVLVLLPLDSVFALVGLVMIGMGCAPIYPSLIHETPENFGKEQSQSLMGLQMACAYVGSTFVPPIFGWLSGIVGLWIFPLYLLCFVVLMIFMSEKVNRTHAQVNH